MITYLGPLINDREEENPQISQISQIQEEMAGAQWALRIHYL
ncbi:protein of unknown function [Candidatus Promineifilum breve]|uniref:Uncharacterized protein n=1 Tax=Candidatus Promineifilum breve TaxID=1806508 RepID=A0A160T429_9CHLR|nr:protein of unknown function [Candidatus Promineifilum breve]